MEKCETTPYLVADLFAAWCRLVSDRSHPPREATALAVWAGGGAYEPSARGKSEPPPSMDFSPFGRHFAVHCHPSSPPPLRLDSRLVSSRVRPPAAACADLHPASGVLLLHSAASWPPRGGGAGELTS